MLMKIFFRSWFQVGVYGMSGCDGDVCLPTVHQCLSRFLKFASPACATVLIQEQRVIYQKLFCKYCRLESMPRREVYHRLCNPWRPIKICWLTNWCTEY